MGALAPAVLLAKLDTLGRHTRQWRSGDDIGAGVDEACGLLAGFRIIDDRVESLLRHLLRELHDRRGNLPRRDIFHAETAAVDRCQYDALGLSSRADRGIGAFRRWLVHSGATM